MVRDREGKGISATLAIRLPVGLVTSAIEPKHEG